MKYDKDFEVHEFYFSVWNEANELTYSTKCRIRCDCKTEIAKMTEFLYTKLCP